MDLTSLTFLLGNLVGLFLKRKPEFANKYIPLVVLGVNLVLNFLKGAGVETAHAAEGVVLASLWSSLGATAWAILKQTLIDTLLSVGLHSAVKNTAAR